MPRPTPRWKRVGKNHAVEHIDPGTDICFFLMNYEPSVSYDESEAKSLILNFKALSRGPISERQKPYRDNACRRFANDLEPLVKDLLSDLGDGNAAITFIPTSTLPGDDGYDDRLETVCRFVVEKFQPRLSLVTPTVSKAGRSPVSKSGGRRGPAYIAAISDNLSWQGFEAEPNLLIVIDDVVTSGGQFKAIKNLVLENASQSIVVVGIFWAMTIHRPEMNQSPPTAF